jgi:hypothetical protein
MGFDFLAFCTRLGLGPNSPCSSWCGGKTRKACVLNASTPDQVDVAYRTPMMNLMELVEARAQISENLSLAFGRS